MGASNLDDRKLRELFSSLSNPSPAMPDEDDLRDLLIEFIEVQAGVAGITLSAIGGNQVTLGPYDPEEVCKKIEDYDTTNLSPDDYLSLAEWKREAQDVMTVARYLKTGE